MYELFGGNPFDLMAEVLRLAEQKRKRHIGTHQH